MSPSKPGPGASAKPVYLVKGDDSTLLADDLRDLLGALVGGDDPALAVEDLTMQPGDDQRIAVLLDACLTPPMFTDRRIVVARNAGSITADEAARVVEYLEQPLESTVLVLVGGGGTVPAKLVSAIKAAGEQIDASAPRQGKARTTWIVDRLKQSPLQFDAKAGNRLGEHLGEDVGRLAGILDVLVSTYGEGARIGVAEIEPFLGEAGATAPWDLTDAIDRGDTAGALEQLKRLSGAGDRHPMVVLSTLHRHFQAMLRLDGAGVTSEAEAAQVLGLRGSTFPARKALSSSRKLGGAKVRRAILLIADADLDLRGAKAWPEALVMEVLVARLCQLSKG